MEKEDEISFWLAGGLLKAGGEDVQALVLEAIRDEVASGVTLDEALTSASKSERQAGDLGVEFIGPLLLPLLIEALKIFWKAYASELQKKVAGDLAKFSVDKVKELLRGAFVGPNKAAAAASLEDSLRQVAEKHKLDAAATERLLSLAQSPKLASELNVDS
jgi:hypothetical protein